MKLIMSVFVGLLVGLFVLAQTEVQAETDLVGYWSFDELDLDGKVPDLSGLDNKGTLEGDASLTDVNAIRGNALLLDGTDAYVSINSASSLDITGPLTIEAWIYAENTGDAGIIGKANGSPFYLSPYSIQVNSSRYVFSIGNGQTTANTCRDYDTSTIPTGVWTYYVSVLDASKLHIYKNATEVNSGNVSRTISPFTNAVNLAIGSMTPGGYKCFNGRIDEVRIYSRALARYEILTHYLEYVGVTPHVEAINDVFLTTPLYFDVSPQALNVKSQGDEFTAARLVLDTDALVDLTTDVTVNLSVDAGWNLGIGTYEVKLDGNQVGSGTGTPPTSIVLSGVGLGEHTVTLTAADVYNLDSRSDSKSFNVRGAVALEDFIGGTYTLIVNGVSIPGTAVDPNVVIVANRQSVIDAVAGISGGQEVSVELIGSDKNGDPVAGEDTIRVFDPTTDRGVSGKTK